MYIVTQLIGKKEKEDLQKLFISLDKNADGKLSKEELISGYTEICGSKERAIEEVDIIMKNADADGSGFIDYSEFLMASLNKKQMLSRENLKKAFSLFDKDRKSVV